MSLNKGQQPLELELPKKEEKKRKGYYLPTDVINYIKSESDRLSTPGPPGDKKEIVSENDVLVAIVRCYQKMATIDGDGGAAYNVDSKVGDHE